MFNTHTHTHTRAHRHAQIFICAHKHIHTHAHTHTQSHTHTYTSTHIHIRTYTHTRAHAHAHAHTHIRFHAQWNKHISLMSTFQINFAGFPTHTGITSVTPQETTVARVTAIVLRCSHRTVTKKFVISAAYSVLMRALSTPILARSSVHRHAGSSKIFVGSQHGVVS